MRIKVVTAPFSSVFSISIGDKVSKTAMQLQLCISLPKRSLPLVLKIVPDDTEMSKQSVLTAHCYNPLYVVHHPKPAPFDWLHNQYQ